MNLSIFVHFEIAYLDVAAFIQNKDFLSTKFLEITTATSQDRSIVLLNGPSECIENCWELLKRYTTGRDRKVHSHFYNAYTA